MSDDANEIDDIRLDIATLRTLIDLALAKGVGSDDILLKACADVLYKRQARLDKLQDTT